MSGIQEKKSWVYHDIMVQGYKVIRLLKRRSMKGTNFNGTCESPSVVMLWAGAAVPQEKTLIHAPLLATSGGGASWFFSFFNFRFSFRVSWAFFCFSLLPLSFFPLSAIFVSPSANGVNPMSTPTSCFTDANPMPRKRKPPLTNLLVSQWGLG